MLKIVFMLMAAFASCLQAQPVKLQLDPQPGATGYKVYRGSAPLEYMTVVDIGPNLTYTFPDLPPGTHHFAAKAYDATTESGYSNLQQITLPPLVDVTPATPLSAYKVVATPKPDTTVTKWVWKFPGAINPGATKALPKAVTVYYLVPGEYKGSLVKYVGPDVKEVLEFPVSVK